MAEEKVRVHVFVSGRVQGVFYRATCRDLAKRLKLCGWVRNLDDGRVEAVFEGPKEVVDKMVDWTRKGPPGAHVADVEVISETPTGEKNFEISY